MAVPKSAVRKLNIKTDLGAVADLIELCFSPFMDPDGWSYLRAIRRAAHNPKYVRWMSGPNERVTYPLFGYIWEEDGKIVGNLSLIPTYRQHEWRYIIANVAVHPDYRRRGIARELVNQSILHMHKQGADSAWLQVREDNPPAVRLYRELGFLERARRTTWVHKDISSLPIQSEREIAITGRHLEDWEQQKQMLEANYPPEVTWNLPFKQERLSPSIQNRLVQILNGDMMRHWAARWHRQLIGTVTWEPSLAYADNLWVAAEPGGEEAAIRTLLPRVQKDLLNGRPLAVNYPAGRAASAFLDAGFEPENTLVWMELRRVD